MFRITALSVVWLCMALSTASAEVRHVVWFSPAQPAPDSTYELPEGVDFNLDGVADYRFITGTVQTQSVPPSTTIWWQALEGLNGSQLLAANGDAVRFTVGQQVLPPSFVNLLGPDWADTGNLYAISFHSLSGLPPTETGPWAEHPTGAIPLALHAADGMHTGWLFYGDLTNRSGLPLPFARLLGWAYETQPETPVTIDSIPEPASVLLFLPAIALIRRRPVR